MDRSGTLAGVVEVTRKGSWKVPEGTAIPALPDPSGYPGARERWAQGRREGLSGGGGAGRKRRRRREGKQEQEQSA